MINTERQVLQTPLHKSHNYKFVLIFLIFIAISVFIFFYRLDVPSIRMWDESRLAVNALEMNLNGNFFVTYFDGKPDMWNTKPPLSIWLIAASMKFLGYNELALRLPSAVCAMTVAVIVFLFGKNYFHDLKMAVLSGCVLITSIGFIGPHVARTGDYDAMLVLWITVYSLSYFTYLHAKESKKSFSFILTAIAVILAVWTKGIAAIMCLPGLLIYTAWQRKLNTLLLSPQFYAVATIVLILACSPYLLREHYNPGYLNAVLNNEITGRYLNQIENHHANFYFYLQGMLKSKFVPWIYMIPVSFIATQVSHKKTIKNFGIFGILYLTCYSIIIFSAKTKLPWYDAPLYPIASLIVGIGLAEIFNRVDNFCKSNKNLSIWKFLLSLVIILCVFFICWHITYKIYKGELYSRASNSLLVYGDYLKHIENTQSLTKFAVLNNGYNSSPIIKDSGYNAPLIFYVKAANLGKYSIKLASYSADEVFKTGETIVTCDTKIKQDLEQKYTLKLLDTKNLCFTAVIKDSKDKGNQL